MTKIEWTDITWNPTTGCNKISPGCKNCYAETMHKRLKGMGQQKYQRDFSSGVQTWEDELMKPLSWKKPAMVFVNSMSDLFHEDVPFEFIDKVFAVMVLSHKHTFQVLTKRARRMAQYFSDDMNVLIDRWANATYEMGLSDEQGDNDAPACSVYNLCSGYAPKNVWPGVSVENQKYADERIPDLLKCPAAVRFLSCEPLLGSLDLQKYFYAEWETPGIDSLVDWVIVGGESGHRARPMHPDWVRSVRDQCVAAGVSFFFKQWGNWAFDIEFNTLQELQSHIDSKMDIPKGEIQVINTSGKHNDRIIRDGMHEPHCIVRNVGKKKAGRELDGRTWDEMPAHLDEISKNESIQECYKTGGPCKYDCSGLCKESC